MTGGSVERKRQESPPLIAARIAAPPLPLHHSERARLSERLDLALPATTALLHPMMSQRVP